MPRSLRRYLIACIAITFAHLMWHATEPLRLNIGDPWSDAELVSSVTGRAVAPATPNVVADSPLSAIVYGAVAKLGVTDIGTFRVLALVVSALGALALFHYLRRMWSDSVAWIGTALFTTNLLSLMHADSLQSPPLAHTACFIALWGVVRAVETGQLRHHAAAMLGSFACMFASSDDWLFLAAGALCTILSKRGDPLARGNFRFVVTCAVGAIAGVVARLRFVVDTPHWPSMLDNKFVAPLVSLLTLTLTPMIWVAITSAVWQALRSSSLRAALDSAMSWLVAVAVILVWISSPRPGPPMLRVVSVMPFFATGSALWIDRVLQAGTLRRRALGIAWIVIATVWGLGITLRHTHAVLARDDVASVRAYLERNDGNDFVLSNLLSNGVVQGAFDRTSWSPIFENDTATADDRRLRVLDVLEAAGTDYVHAVIFTTPTSRFIDRSLGQLTRYRGLGPVSAWPYLRRNRANELIDAYDAEVRQLLDATGAERVLHFDNFDVYRIDRDTVVEHAGRSIPVVRKIDFSSRESNRYELLGWIGPELSEFHKIGVSSIFGYAACSNPRLESRAGYVQSACATAPSDAEWVNRAQLMIRVDHPCDLEMTVTVEPEISPLLWFLADITSPVLGVSLGDFTASQCTSSRQLSFVIPRRFVRDGINIVTFATQPVGLLSSRAALRSLEIDPVCE